MARNININLQGKDNVSPALQTASARLVELRTEIDKLRAKGQVNLTVADTKNLTKLTSEANRLEKALGGVVATGTRGASTLKGAFGELDSVLSGLGLGGLGALATGAGIVAAVSQVGKLTAELGTLGAQSLDTQRSFESVTRSIGATPAILNEISKAAGGTITELRLMQLTNTALAGASGEMGRAFAEAIPKLIEGARAASALNPALGDAEFLFNSLVTGIKRGSPMLIDNTGITLKLGEANEAYAKSLGKSADALTEEEKKVAILNATLSGVDRLVEQAGGSLDTMTSDLQRAGVATQELKTSIGELVAEPYTITVKFLAERIGNIAYWLNKDSGPEKEYAKAAEEYQSAAMEVAKAQENLAGWYAQVNPLAKARYELDLKNAESAEEAARSNYELATMLYQVAQGTYTASGAEDDYVGRLAKSRRAVLEAADAERELNAARGGGSVDWNAKAKSVALVNRYEGMTGAQAADDEERARGYALLRNIATRKEEEKKANAEIAQDYYKRMSSAIDDLTGDVQSKLGGAIQDSIGLKDMTGGDIFKPGANGPFEAIFRAQAVAVGGIENADEQKWAEMYGLTPESAAKIVADFQRGLFSADVIKLIDVNALVGQIQGEQAAAESTQAFAQMIAGQLGVKDAGSLVASQTFQAIAGGVASDPTQQANAAKAVLSAYAQNVQKVVKSDDFAGQMMGFGEATWKSYEDGLLGGAESSAVFNEAIKKAIASFLTANGYTKAPTGGGVVGAVNNAGGALP